MKRIPVWLLIALGVIGCIAVVVLVLLSLDAYRRPPTPAGMIARFTTLECDGWPMSGHGISVFGASHGVVVAHLQPPGEAPHRLQRFDTGSRSARASLLDAVGQPRYLSQGVVLDASTPHPHLVIAGEVEPGTLGQVRIVATEDLQPVTNWIALAPNELQPERIVDVGDWDRDGTEDFALQCWRSMLMPMVQIRSGADGHALLRVEPDYWPSGIEGAVVSRIASAGRFLDESGIGLAVLLSNRGSSPDPLDGEDLVVTRPDDGTPLLVATHKGDGRQWIDVAPVGDVDGDGTSDLVLLESEGLVLVRSKDRKLEPLGDMGRLALGGVSLFAAGDVDGDGVGDLIWNVGRERTLVVSAREGKVLFDDYDAARYAAPFERGWPVGDVDGDGLCDVALVYAREDRSKYDFELADKWLGVSSWVVVISGASLRGARSLAAK